MQICVLYNFDNLLFKNIFFVSFKLILNDSDDYIRIICMLSLKNIYFSLNFKSLKDAHFPKDLKSYLTPLFQFLFSDTNLQTISEMFLIFSSRYFL